MRGFSIIYTFPYIKQQAIHSIPYKISRLRSCPNRLALYYYCLIRHFSTGIIKQIPLAGEFSPAFSWMAAMIFSTASSLTILKMISFSVSTVIPIIDLCTGPEPRALMTVPPPAPAWRAISTTSSAKPALTMM
ncbi:hypothetical protein DSY3595 [Desulfitobacterium hafniense Y51]|uniref:Uncharacterized protein n=1 Tax=Desulfitobacterium hafniense (strain Y51) TaxID=138119 RepID=Q24RF8_DESHY|nr:hypothetical protein DSY3595 [Desulfitobacterium hafniense Y51]